MTLGVLRLSCANRFRSTSAGLSLPAPRDQSPSIHTPNSPFGESRECEGSWVAMSPAWRTPHGRQPIRWTPGPSQLPLNPCLYNCTGESVDEQTSPSSARPICRFPGCVQDWHHFGRRSWRGTGDCLQTRTLVIRCASAPVPVRCLRERASDGGQHTACPLHPVLVVRGGKESCLPPPRRVDERPPA